MDTANAAARAGQGSGSGCMALGVALRGEDGDVLGAVGDKGGGGGVYWRAAEADFLARVRLR